MSTETKTETKKQETVKQTEESTINITVIPTVDQVTIGNLRFYGKRSAKLEEGSAIWIGPKNYYVLNKKKDPESIVLGNTIIHIKDSNSKTYTYSILNSCNNATGRDADVFGNIIIPKGISLWDGNFMIDVHQDIVAKLSEPKN